MNTTLLVEIEGTTLEVGVLLITAPVVSVSSSSVGGGEGLPAGQVGSNLQFKSLTASGVATASSTATEVNIDVPAPPVDSVNGETGAVVLDTDDVAEGATNLYYTDARVDANANVNLATAHANTVIGNPHNLDAADVGADPAGSATAVQVSLTAHIADTGNPHAVTAAQAGADPVGSAAAVQANLTAHEADLANPHAVTAAQAGADPVGSAATVQSNLDTHTGDTANPHATDVGNLGSGTLAELNAAITDATLDDSSDPRTPTSHAPTHSLGGSDEVQLANLSSAPGTPGQVLTAGAANTAVWSTPASAPVDSVNGQTGVVVLDTDDVNEGVTNLYYTEARVDVNASVVANTAKVSADGSINTHSDVNTAAPVPAASDALVWTGSEWAAAAVVNSVNGQTGTAVLDTDDVAEAGNLYYTEARVNANATVVANAAHAALVVGNPHALDAADVGADPAGTGAAAAAAAVAVHIGLPDPHPQYTTAAEAALAAPVQSVNTATGTVVLDTDDVGEGATNLYYTEGRVDANATVVANAAHAAIVVGNPHNLDATDVGADAAGTAAFAISFHEGLPDPHPQYTDTAEAAAAAPVQSVNAATGAVVLDTDDVAEGVTNLYYTDFRVGTSPSVSANTTHRNDVANPHNTDIGNLGGGTLAELNSAISDATLGTLSNTAPTNVNVGLPSAGVSVEAARQDHEHNINTGGATSTIQPDDAAAEGVSTNLAREDHQHAIVAGLPVSIGDANSEGAATSFARSDHVHQYLFGQEIQTAESLGITTTTLAGGVEKLSLVTPSLTLGTYVLHWSYAWNYDSGTSDFLARIQQNNAGGALGSAPGTNLMDHRQEPKDATGAGFGGSNQVHRASGNIILTSLSAVQQFDLDFAPSAGGTTAAIAEARFILYRIS